MALLSAAVAAGFMGSPEGFGRGGVVEGVRWGTEGACSSGGRKGEFNMISIFFGVRVCITAACIFYCLCTCRNN